MESQSKITQTVSALKLPILKTGDYDIWCKRIEQYLTYTYHALWEVIMNGDSPAAITSVSGGAEAAIPPKTTEQKIARRNKLKAKAHLIKTRFGGNKESKKIQKTIMKQQYENFAASRSEGLDKTYDRFRKLISQLEIHGEVISQEDANMKLLRSLPSAWNTHTLIMRNKSNLDTLSMDDLYNNLKLDNDDLEQIDTDVLEEMDLKWQVVMLTMRGNRNGDNTRRVILVESPINALVVTDEMGYEWSYQAEEGPIDVALMAHSSSTSSSSDTEREVLNKANLEIIAYQLGLESLEARIVVHQKNEDVFKEDITFLKYDVKVRDNSTIELKNQLEESLKEQDDLKLKLEKYKAGEGYHAVPPPYTRIFMPLRPDLSFAGLDDSIFRSAMSETVSSVHETKTSASKTSKESMEKPKTIRFSAPLIED
nr:hypothetical protein [Tanacetum cinerariifolium]